MSYVAIITTQKEINYYINESVDFESASHLVNQIFEPKKNENMYLILKKKEFSPPYYPAKNMKNGETIQSFIKVLNIINDQCLITKLFFSDLGEDETIHKIVDCNFKELLELIEQNKIEANFLYKIKHYYAEYNR